MEDAELLLQYANDGSQTAFATLVRRRADFVFAVALRRTGGDIPLAQEVVQLVFFDLARKARSVAQHPAIMSWLYTSTRYAAARAAHNRAKQKHAEDALKTMQQLEGGSQGAIPDWTTIAPVLDQAMDGLPEKDRTAILLRYFDQKSLAEVGAGLGLAENSARMRVERALDKLRRRLARRGIVSTAAALESTLAGQPLVTAPAEFTAAIAQATMPAATGGAGWIFTSILMSTPKQLAAIALILTGGLGLIAYLDRREAALTAQIVTVRTENTRTEQSLRTAERQARQVDGLIMAVAAETDATGIATTSDPYDRIVQKTLRLDLSDLTPGKTASIAQIKDTYPPLFATLQLSPDQEEQLAYLLSDYENQNYNGRLNGQRNGADETTDPVLLELFQGAARAGTVDSIRYLIGEKGYQDFVAWRQAAPNVSAKNQVWLYKRELTAAGTQELTPAQADQLFALFMSAAPPQTAAPGVGYSVRDIPFTEPIMSRAAGFLSDRQVETLRRTAEKQNSTMAERDRQMQATHAAFRAAQSQPPSR